MNRFSPGCTCCEQPPQPPIGVCGGICVDEPFGEIGNWRVELDIDPPANRDKTQIRITGDNGLLIEGLKDGIQCNHQFEFSGAEITTFDLPAGMTCDTSSARVRLTPKSAGAFDANTPGRAGEFWIPNFQWGPWGQSRQQAVCIGGTPTAYYDLTFHDIEPGTGGEPCCDDFDSLVIPVWPSWGDELTAQPTTTALTSRCEQDFGCDGDTTWPENILATVAGVGPDQSPAPEDFCGDLNRSLALSRLVQRGAPWPPNTIQASYQGDVRVRTGVPDTTLGVGGEYFIVMWIRATVVAPNDLEVRIVYGYQNVWTEGGRVRRDNKWWGGRWGRTTTLATPIDCSTLIQFFDVTPAEFQGEFFDGAPGFLIGGECTLTGASVAVSAL